MPDGCLTIDGSTVGKGAIVGDPIPSLFSLVDPSTILELRIRNVFSLELFMDVVIKFIHDQPNLEVIELSASWETSHSS